MKHYTSAFVLVSTLVVLPIAGDIGACEQASQSAVAAQLSSGDPVQQRRALDAIQGIDKSDISDDVKAAMATALHRESLRNTRRYWQGRANQSVESLPDPELVGALARAVAEFGDPRAIPALSEALGTGFAVTRSLAAFGQPAAPAVLNVVTGSQSTHYAVNDGLIALRLMVEAKDVRPLDASTLAAILAAAEHHLTTKPLFIGTTWWAIDLAATLQDSRLKSIVEQFASDPNRSIAMGASDPDVVYQTQRRAADRLAGVAPLPRP